MDALRITNLTVLLIHFLHYQRQALLKTQKWKLATCLQFFSVVRCKRTHIHFLFFCVYVFLCSNASAHKPWSSRPTAQDWDYRYVSVGHQVSGPHASHPWHTHFQLLPTDSRCVSASLLAATCHHSIGSLHSQLRCSKPSKQLQTHSWDTRTTTAAAEQMLGTQSQGTHIHHGRTLRVVCKWDTSTTQNSMGNPWHRDVQQTQS